jgi:hypothetical protein
MPIGIDYHKLTIRKLNDSRVQMSGFCIFAVLGIGNKDIGNPSQCLIAQLVVLSFSHEGPRFKSQLGR